jgi:hypothetical protein
LVGRDTLFLEPCHTLLVNFHIPRSRHLLRVCRRHTHWPVTISLIDPRVDLSRTQY